jgi:PKHD-type hydroxylase
MNLYQQPATPHEYNDDVNRFFEFVPFVLTDEEVALAREMFDAGHATIGMVGRDYGAVFVEDHNLRKCTVTYTPRTDSNQWLHEKLERLMLEANNKYWKLNITDFGEVMRQMRYGPTDHFKSWHVDHGPGDTAFRKLTMIVQLSDESEYTGGDFQFAGFPIDNSPDFGPINPKAKGCGIIFPTYVFHRVTPILSGERRTLVFRACGPHLR